METEQLAPECWLDKQWNEGRNKNVLRNQWEWRHNIPESLGHRERSKIDTLSSKLKELEEEGQKKLKS